APRAGREIVQIAERLLATLARRARRRVLAQVRAPLLDLREQLGLLLLGRDLPEDLAEARRTRRDRRVVGRVDPARLVGAHPGVGPVAADVLGHAPALGAAAELRVLVAVVVGAFAAGVVAR